MRICSKSLPSSLNRVSVFKWRGMGKSIRLVEFSPFSDVAHSFGSSNIVCVSVHTLVCCTKQSFSTLCDLYFSFLTSSGCFHFHSVHFRVSFVKWNWNFFFATLLRAWRVDMIFPPSSSVVIWIVTSWVDFLQNNAFLNRNEKLWKFFSNNFQHFFVCWIDSPPS